MRLIHILRLRLRSLFFRNAVERELDEELRYHLERQIAEEISRGCSPDEARYAALQSVKDIEQKKEECRDMRHMNWLDEIARNSRHAFRTLLKSPFFSLTAVLSLALGLTAVGITLAVVDTILLQPLPFVESDSIVVISQKIPFLGSSHSVVTADEFERWQHTGLFDSAALIDTAEFTLDQQGHPERIYGATVTPGFFRVFGLQPAIGRSFSQTDATEGRDGVIILSHRLWSRDFRSDPSVLGKKIDLSGAPMTVIGVMPPGFEFPRLADVSQIMNWAPEQTDFWIPLVITPQITEGGNFNYYALARLRKGVTRVRAAAQLLPAAVHLFKEKEVKYPSYKGLIEQILGSFEIYVTPLRETMAWGIRDALWMILAAVALLFVLVLFNLGNLLLTRNTNRMREYTVRRALGASRRQLFLQGFFEHGALVGVASVLAAALIVLGLDAIRVAAPNHLPRLADLRFSPTELVLLIGATFFTAAIFGSLSQFLISEGLLTFGLNSQGRTSTSDRRTNRMRFTLITAEVAMSAVLLVASGLLLKSFRNVMQEPLGFNPHNVLTVNVSFNPRNTNKPEKRMQHIRELIEGLDVLPGVSSASVVSRLPLMGDSEIHDVGALGKPVPQTPDNVSAEYRVIDSAYFRTMQIALLAGREFRPDDQSNFAVINQKMSSRLWPGADPIGQQFTDGDNPPLTVIGVVANVHNASPEKPAMMQFYRPLTAAPYRAGTFVIRSDYDPDRLLPMVQKVIWRLDSSEPATHAQTMQKLLDSVTLNRRFETGLLSAYAFVALFLAALGLFGVASLSAVRRTREFGIRLAVGATRSQIIRLECGRTLRTVTLGLGIGLLASVATARAMSSLLYRVTPWNAGIFILAALVLTASALIAAWLPARRAAAIDPAAALRTE